jgi:ubiquinone/menaquinone biosynthesis C-methylase UbiE
MKRIPEPELMNDPAQARAYAGADFAAPHSQFIELFRQTFPDYDGQGVVLDLGCGPADITLRFARAWPACTVHGVDGAPAMLQPGRQAVDAAGLADRITLLEGRLPGVTLPLPQYDAVISNSLLHHLAEPQVLWDSIKRYARPQAPVFVMDLRRPDSVTAAAQLVETYAGDEPAILREDFYRSLLAAYTVEEVAAQLQVAGLALALRVVSDRHFIVHGFVS